MASNLPYFVPDGYRVITTIPQEKHYNEIHKNGEEIIQEPDDIFVSDYIRKIVANSKGENDG